MSQRRSIPTWLLIGILGIVYFAAANLGLRLARVHPSATAVWPPAGIALAAVLLFGYRVWPGIFLGAFLANVTTAGTAATALGIASGNTLEGILGAYLVSRFCGGVNAFDRAEDVFKFTFLAAALSTTVSATFGVTSLSLGGYASWSDYGAVWFTWWLGDAGGDLIVAPLLLLWGLNPRIRWTWNQLVEAGFLLLFFVVGTQIVFGGWSPVRDPLPLLYVTVLIWAAFRFGQRETATVTFLTAAVGIWGTLGGAGPFVRGSQHESFLLLALFMCIISVTVMALAAGVSQRKRLEQRFRLVVESAPNGMVMVDQDGKIILAKRDELLGTPVELLVPDRFRDRHPRYRFEFAQARQARPIGAGRDLYGRRKDGSEVPVEIGLNPLAAERGGLVLASIIDISERKRVEEQLRQYAAELESFSFRVAHDLRSPLVSIAGLSQMLHRDLAKRMDLRSLGHIQSIIDYADNMDTLIKGLLAYGRFSRVEPNLERWSLESLMPEVLRRLAEQLRRSSAQVDLQKPLPEVVADRVALVEILGHLLSNAVKFVQPGLSPQIRVRAEERESFVRLWVEDNGIGIARADQERIFRIFERLHGRAYAGYGIGLAIVARGMAWMGGSAGVESEVGKGSRFWIELPRPQMEA
ncbi:MAG: MASE1 domain-containing protein [Deltaproteobacteria bacterium]|nr:MASE1 domain-containing protein [Deltaproteobacteria bacterium]